MKKLFVLALFLLTATISYSQRGRLQIGVLADVTDQRILLDIQAHPTIRYFVSNRFLVSVSGIYAHTINGIDRKYINMSGRYYPFRTKGFYGQAGTESNFAGSNIFNTQVGYTSNFGPVWVEPFVNGGFSKNSTLVQIGIGAGLSLN